MRISSVNFLQLGILAHTFPPERRIRSIAFATLGAGAPVGGVLGNVIGGILTQLTAYVLGYPELLFGLTPSSVRAGARRSGS